MDPSCLVKTLGDYVIPEPILHLGSIHGYTDPEAMHAGKPLSLLSFEAFQSELQAYIKLDKIGRNQN
jgi:hypothetical protein